MLPGDLPQTGRKPRVLPRVLGYYAVVFLLTHALVAVYLLTGGSWSRPDSFLFAYRLDNPAK